MDSYEILGVNKDFSDKEIEIAYNDLIRKYDPSFNTSIHAYKKYREILMAYENIKDEKRRKMYDLKDNQEKKNVTVKEYELYHFDDNKEIKEKKEIDYSKIEDFSLVGYKDVEVTVRASYLYYLLNLRYDLEYFHKVKCNECKEYVVCSLCEGEKVVEHENHLIWCPNCKGEGKVSVNCKSCGDSGFVEVKDSLSFYVDEDKKVFKGYGEEYGKNIRSNLVVNFDFYDKENVTVSDEAIEVIYNLDKEETINGLNKEYFSEFGAFKIEVPSYVNDGYKQEINFNNKKVIFTFYNRKLDGDNITRYLFINKVYKDKYLYFNEDYSECSEEETLDCKIMVKCASKMFIEERGFSGKYGGKNGDLIIETYFNNEDELLYTDKVICLDTSKTFNLLGGNFEGIYHYGLKRANSLIEKNNVYYLLKGNSDEKNKLKNYFWFKVFSIFMWILIPFLMLVLSYDATMFIVVGAVILGYSILINLLMEVEV